MINQEFKAQGRIYQVLPNFGVCCRELGGSKLRDFAHACAVSALSCQIDYFSNSYISKILKFMKSCLNLIISNFACHIMNATISSV